MRYLLVELLGGGAGALGCRWRFGTAYTLGEGLFGTPVGQGLLALALRGAPLSIALIDAETQLIPNRLNAAVAVLAAPQPAALPLPGGPGRSSARAAH